MHYKIFIGICLLLSVVLLPAAYGHPAWASPCGASQDSVGLEKKAGEVFILHQIEQGETLFSIAQRYGIQMDALKSSNPDINTKKLNAGDTLRVPLFPKLFVGEKIHHTVQEGETLFQISQKYKVSIEEIRKWNVLGNQSLSVGEELIVYLTKPTPDSRGTAPNWQQYITHTVQAGETLYAIAKAYQTDADSLRRLNQLPDESIAVGQRLLIREKQGLPVTVVRQVSLPVAGDVAVQKTTKPEEDRNSLPDDETTEEKVSRPEVLEKEKERVKRIRLEEKKALSEYKKVTENGFAAAIPGRADTQKFLALHRTAPVGTILQVRNEMNNVSVFVRVVGKLPGTGANDKVDIRISQAAYEKLGGINERFPVEITYLK